VEREDPRRLALFTRLCGIGFAAHLAYNLARDPVLSLWARHLGFSPQLVGVLMGASTLTGVFTKFLFGAFSDSVGRRRMLLLATAVTGFVPIFYFLGDSFPYLIAVRLVQGIATAILGPVGSAVVADLAASDERGFRLGTFSSAFRSGQLVAPWIGGFLIQWAGYRYPFAAAAIAGVVAFAMTLTWPETATVERRTMRRHLARMREGFREVFSSRPILATSVAEALQFFATGLLQAMLPIYATEVAGLSPLQAGTLWGVQLAVPILSKPLFGRLSDRWGRIGQIVAGFVIGAIGVFTVVLTTSFWPLMLACALYGLGVAVTTSATAAYVTDLCRQQDYGAAHGVFGTIYDIGHWGGQTLSGILVGAVGYQVTFGIYAGGLLVASVMFAFLGRAPTERVRSSSAARPGASG
jgi:MFS transporter, DHA1 family, multidrug resistance protein